MKTIRLSLEWSCDPVWVYEEDGIASTPGLPEELEDNKELVDLMNKIRTEFDNTSILKKNLQVLVSKQKRNGKNSSKTSSNSLQWSRKPSEINTNLSMTSTTETINVEKAFLSFFLTVKLRITANSH